MNNNAARLAELFSLAQQKDVYGSIAQRLTDAQHLAERDISAYAGTLKQADSERALDQNVLHYSYGL